MPAELIGCAVSEFPVKGSRPVAVIGAKAHVIPARVSGVRGLSGATSKRPEVTGLPARQARA